MRSYAGSVAGAFKYADPACWYEASLANLSVTTIKSLTEL